MTSPAVAGADDESWDLYDSGPRVGSSGDSQALCVCVCVCVCRRGESYRPWWLSPASKDNKNRPAFDAGARVLVAAAWRSAALSGAHVEHPPLRPRLLIDSSNAGLAAQGGTDTHTHAHTRTHTHTHTHTHHHHHHPIQPIHPRQLRLRVKAVAGPRLVCFVPGKRRLPRADAARSRYCEIIPAAPGPGTREAAFPRHNAIQTCSCSRPDLRYKWSQKLSVKLRINDTFLGCLIIYWRVTKKQWADGTVGLEEWIDDKCSENWARFGINLTVINAMV